MIPGQMVVFTADKELIKMNNEHSVVDSAVGSIVMLHNKDM